MTPPSVSPFVLTLPPLPCGHAAANMIEIDGVRLGCLQCQIDMSRELILHMENLTRLEKLEKA
jgi:hypothetical protein